MSGIRAASGLVSLAKMSDKEYRTHCEVIGRIIASAVENGHFWNTGADDAVKYYMNRVGIQDGRNKV